MGLLHSENLAVVPSEFRRRAVIRLKNIKDYLTDIIESVQDEDAPDYRKLASNVANTRMSLAQMEYSFEEIANFLENLSENVNAIVEEKVNDKD